MCVSVCVCLSVCVFRGVAKGREQDMLFCCSIFQREPKGAELVLLGDRREPCLSAALADATLQVSKARRGERDERGATAFSLIVFSLSQGELSRDQAHTEQFSLPPISPAVRPPSRWVRVGQQKRRRWWWSGGWWWWWWCWKR